MFKINTVTITAPVIIIKTLSYGLTTLNSTKPNIPQENTSTNNANNKS